MSEHAVGTFEVKLEPQGGADAAAGSTLGRMSITKQFRGELEATSRGEMLTAMTEVAGSAAYVAVERVAGALHGREGSFALVHRGIMTRGTPDLTIFIVPDSGTGDLAGIAERMDIEVSEGRHSYRLSYTLDAR